MSQHGARVCSVGYWGRQNSLGWGPGMAVVFRVRMSDGVAARTDGTDIWVDDRLNEVQLKCAVAHEEVHIERGHSTLQPEAIEMSVRYEVAKRLLPLEAIAGVCKQGRSLAMIAKDLEVTRQVLMDRAATLTDNQALAAGCLSCLKCPAIAARYAVVEPRLQWIVPRFSEQHQATGSAGSPPSPERTQRNKMLAA
jgi:hypothetical protein